jgi:hypothetical protein
MILYLCSCRRCAFQVHSSDVLAIKELMMQHLTKSHRQPFSLVASVPLKDFKELFIIDRIRDISDKDAKAFDWATGHPRYWKVQRTKPQNLPIISGLGNGEFKLFLKSERD